MHQTHTIENRKFKFTQKQIDALPSQSKDSPSAMAEYSDIEVVGLKLAVSKSGHKFYWHRYRYRGKKRMVKLGEHPSLNVNQARQMVNENKNVLARDLDPADERKRHRSVPTLSEFAEQTYLPNARLHKRSWRDDESKIRRDIGELLGGIPINEVSTPDIMHLHSTIANRASPATANRYLALISGIFSLAINCDIITRNPAKGVKKFREAEPRKRSLSGDELGRFILALDESGKITSFALKLLLLTGMRRMELFSLKWSEVDIEAGTVQLLHTKNGRSRTVALNSLALELMKKIQTEASPSCPWVFPSRNGSHITDARKALWRAMKLAGIKDLHPHDLRRSFASLLVNANVDIYQIKDLLGHSSVSVTQKAYAHLQQNTLRSASEVMVKTLEDTLGRMGVPPQTQPDMSAMISY
jgi:integrase